MAGKHSLSHSHDAASPAAGSVLPLKRAEELLLTLPGVVSAHIIAGEAGAIGEVHVLAAADIPPKQIVRNIESALIAHLGLHVDHRKISVATTSDAAAIAQSQRAARPVEERERKRRHLYFEDIHVRRSRSAGVTCRVTLRKGERSFEGEAEGAESPRSRAELAARATLAALETSDPGQYAAQFEGCEQVDAFDRQYVFVGLTARLGREPMLLTGSCELKDSPETAAVLAVLDATNRLVGKSR